MVLTKPIPTTHSRWILGGHSECLKYAFHGLTMVYPWFIHGLHSQGCQGARARNLSWQAALQRENTSQNGHGNHVEIPLDWWRRISRHLVLLLNTIILLRRYGLHRIMIKYCMILHGIICRIINQQRLLRHLKHWSWGKWRYQLGRAVSWRCLFSRPNWPHWSCFAD